MNAVILAAGRGSRLRDLTEDRPKCLLRVGGRTLLDWQTSALRAAGVQRIAVVTGYRGAQLQSADVTCFENPRWAETNMVRSLQAAGAWLAAGPCIVSYSDIIYMSSAVSALASVSGDIAITYDVNWRALWQTRFDDPLSDAETFKLTPGGDVREIGSKPRSIDEIEGQYMGLLRFTPSGWSAVGSYLAQLADAAVDRLDMTSLLRGLIASGIRVKAVPVSDPWFEVDNERDLAVASAALGDRA